VVGRRRSSAPFRYGALALFLQRASGVAGRAMAILRACARAAWCRGATDASTWARVCLPTSAAARPPGRARRKAAIGERCGVQYAASRAR